MPRTFLYRCPNTSQNVQGWSADEVTDDDDTYELFQCVARTRVHLVNLKTRKVLGEREELRPRVTIWPDLVFNCSNFRVANERCSTRTASSNIAKVSTRVRVAK